MFLFFFPLSHQQNQRTRNKLNYLKSFTDCLTHFLYDFKYLMNEKTCWLIISASDPLFLPLSVSCSVAPDSSVRFLLLPCFALSFIISVIQFSPSTWHNICFGSAAHATLKRIPTNGALRRLEARSPLYVRCQFARQPTRCPAPSWISGPVPRFHCGSYLLFICYF